MYLYILLGKTVADDIDASITMNDGKKSFTSKFCNKNGKSDRVLNVPKKGIQVINHDALNSCTELVSFDFSRNQITSLDPNLFKFNENLEHIQLYCNQITSVSPKLFVSLKNLWHINLNGNPLGMMPPIFGVNLPRLKELHLDNTGIFAEDMNVDILKHYFPNLVKIAFHCNNMECKTVKIIKAAFNRNGIKVDQY